MNEYISNTITISAVKVRFYFQQPNVCSSFYGKNFIFSSIYNKNSKSITIFADEE